MRFIQNGRDKSIKEHFKIGRERYSDIDIENRRKCIRNIIKENIYAILQSLYTYTYWRYIYKKIWYQTRIEMKYTQ